MTAMITKLKVTNYHALCLSVFLYLKFNTLQMRLRIIKMQNY